jgi:hypothetical protein
VLLQSKVLPLLQAQVVVDDQEVARAPVALAIIKLIKVCTPSAGLCGAPQSVGGHSHLSPTLPSACSCYSMRLIEWRRRMC